MRSKPTALAWSLALGITVALTILVSQPAPAQTYSVLHSFTGDADGAYPMAGLTIDAAGNLYGTAYFGGYEGSGCTACGTVFKLSRKGSGWIFDSLHNFQDAPDGRGPCGRLTFGPDGTLYGATSWGGVNGGGSAFNIKPQARACLTALCPWTLTVIHSFAGVNGEVPYGDVAFDAAGNLYGTTTEGGRGNGNAYELSPSNGSWTETNLNIFQDGSTPYSGVILDHAGNVYGTSYYADSGFIYELSPPGWQFQQLHRFDGGDGFDPLGGLIFDSDGNLYGGTLLGGSHDYGTIYELSPSNGGWTLTTLYNFTQGNSNTGGGPWSSLIMDAAGDLYGTTYSGGIYGYGSVFKLTHSSGGWTYTSLHDFCTGGYPCADGAYPYSNVVFDKKGNLYGTASKGGACPSGDQDSCGVVWMITP